MNNPKYALTHHNKKQYLYYIGLFNTANADFDGVVKTYSTISRVDSAIHEYFPLLSNCLNLRNNWLQMNATQAFVYPEIDFAMTNFAKIQTKSRVHSRILLDTQEHFISNKGAFYSTFKDYDFIPTYCSATLIRKKLLHNGLSMFQPDDYVIVKPDKGSLGMHIHIIRYKDIETVAWHDGYQDWTISKIYIAKLYGAPFKQVIVSNRIYFAVVKINNKVSGHIFDEFVNYCAMENFVGDGSDFNPNNFSKRILTNYSPDGYTETQFYLNRYVSHKKYMSLFTREEYSNIFQRICDYIKIITQKISQHILCANDHYSEQDPHCAFHLYGIDAIIDDSHEIKIIEINGAPSISDRTHFYPTTECMNYEILINELLKITVDKIITPASQVYMKYHDDDKYNYGFYKDSMESEQLFTYTFKPVCEFQIQPLPNKFYISKQVALKYPFILNGFFNKQRSYFYQRIKNPNHPRIDVFYGLRDLYTNKFTSEEYYNEVVEYNNCVCSRNAKILNKIQGVTYYLANKERLYLKLLQHYPRDALFYHPKSIIIKVSKRAKKCSPEMIANIRIITTFFSENPECPKFIIKPCNGSQGKGIKIIDTIEPYYVCNVIQDIQKQYDYVSFLISTYIDNPKLQCKHGDISGGRKFNIRFYVLLFMENDKLQVYCMNRQIVYYTVLEYQGSLHYPFNTATSVDIEQMRSLTNLQIVSNMNDKYKWSLKMEDYLDGFENLGYNPELVNSIQTQFLNICRQTITSTKSEYRSINRFIPDHATFNLVAYDMLLDNTDILHLIEINRGADLVGLQRIATMPVITKIFEELFDICVDGKTDGFRYFEPVLL